MSAEPTQDPETPYQAAEPESGDNTLRRGHLFFGLCDMRVATVAVNALNMGILIVSMLVHLLQFFGLIPIQVAVPALIWSGIAIFGAVNYELWAVVMAVVGFVIGLFTDLYTLNYFGIIMGILTIYPTASLAYYIREGIITQDNYKQEEFLNYGLAEKAGIKKETIDEFPGKVAGKVAELTQPKKPAADV